MWSARCEYSKCMCSLLLREQGVLVSGGKCPCIRREVSLYPEGSVPVSGGKCPCIRREVSLYPEGGVPVTKGVSPYHNPDNNIIFSFKIRKKHYHNVIVLKRTSRRKAEASAGSCWRSNKQFLRNLYLRTSFFRTSVTCCLIETKSRLFRIFLD
jgi:hypothetical protein